MELDKDLIEQILLETKSDYKELLTFDDLEKTYQLTKRITAQLVKENKLPVIKINKRVFRFRPADIEQFIEQQAVGAL
jgi:hypothetical protein